MLKKIIDTNIFIDRFLDPDRFKDIFLSEGLVYLSSIVFMELRAGARSQTIALLLHLPELSVPHYIPRTEKILKQSVKLQILRLFLYKIAGISLGERRFKILLMLL